MKKVISLVLVFAIVFSLMAGMGISSNAGTNGHSQADALAWLNSKIGIQIGNGQCPALAREYYSYLGYSVSGNGKDYENNVPSGWQRIYYYAGFVPQAGDVAVWRATNTQLGKIYGHVAIVKSGSSSNMICYEQGNSAGNKVRTNTYSYGSVTCFIRPDFSSGSSTSSKTPVNLGNDFYAYIIKTNSWKHLANENDNLQLSLKGNDSYSPRQIWHFIRQSNGSYKIISTYDNRSLDADNCGSANETNIKLYTDYDTVAQKWFIYQNGSGYNIASSYCDKVFDVAGSRDDAGTNVQFYTSNNTNAQIFSIYNIQNDGWTYQKPSAPSKPTVSTSVNAKTVTVSWSKAALNGKLDQREYDIRIYKNNTNNSAIFTKFGLTGTSYSYTLNDSGTYYVTIAAVNAKYYNYFSMSNAVKFTISTNCSHSYSSTITKSATCTAEGIKTFTCSKCGNQYTQSIAALGHNYSGTVTKAATCTEKGIKTFKCSRCTSSYTQDIAALGHNWVKSVQPACIEYEGSWDGYSETKCNRCSASSKKTISAIDRMILSSERFVYTGSAFTPSVKVVDTDGKALKKGEDYKVTYQSGRKAVGSYWVKFTFMGNYQGEITQWFKIIPKGTSLAKLTAGKKSFTAKWKKLGGITGYQIQYSTNAKFTGAKKVTIKGATAAGKTIKNLKAKQVYYVRVRTYKTVSGTHYMSNWSKTYKVKTK